MSDITHEEYRISTGIFNDPPPRPLSDEDRATILASARAWYAEFRKRVHTIEDLSPEDLSQVAK